jgi:hypothetical protein
MILEEQSQERQLLERFYLTLETKEDKKTFESIDLYFRLGLKIEKRDALDAQNHQKIEDLEKEVAKLKDENQTFKVLRNVIDMLLKEWNY